GPALEHTEQRRPLRPDRVEHGPHVVHPGLERRYVAHAIGKPGAPAVEGDHARVASEAVEHGAVLRPLELDLEMADRAVHEDQVDWALTVYEVRDRHVAAPRIADLGRHRLQLWPRPRPNGSFSSPGSG